MKNAHITPPLFILSWLLIFICYLLGDSYFILLYTGNIFENFHRKSIIVICFLYLIIFLFKQN